MNNNEKFECIDFSFDRENIICSIVPQASIHNDDVLLILLRIGHHLDDNFIAIFGVLSDGMFQDLCHFVG